MIKIETTYTQICDRCGEVVHGLTTIYKADAFRSWSGTCDHTKYFDLCMECWLKLDDFLKVSR
jgi:hypothetical protein